MVLLGNRATHGLRPRFVNGICARLRDRRGLGGDRAHLRLRRHLATGYQYRDHYRDISNGVLVQNTQNRDARALHLKLDELLRSMENARNKLIDLENCSDDELAHIERQFQALKHRQQRKQNDEGYRLRTR